MGRLPDRSSRQTGTSGMTRALDPKQPSAGSDASAGRFLPPAERHEHGDPECFGGRRSDVAGEFGVASERSKSGADVHVGKDECQPAGSGRGLYQYCRRGEPGAGHRHDSSFRPELASRRRTGTELYERSWWMACHMGSNDRLERPGPQRQRDLHQYRCLGDTIVWDDPSVWAGPGISSETVVWDESIVHGQVIAETIVWDDCDAMTAVWDDSN